MFGRRIVELRKKRGLTQEELAKNLGISRSSLSLYEIEKREPDTEIIIKLAKYFSVSTDYLLGLDSDDLCLNTLLGYSGNDEDTVSFPQKLANQIDFNQKKIYELATELEVKEEVIIGWLMGTDETYPQYYKPLSKIFELQERYWTSSRALSPGIEPNMEEYILILLYRAYQEKGEFSDLYDLYGSLEDYFPGICVTTNHFEKRIIDTFRQLNEDNQYIIMGEMKKLLKEQHYDVSVAADEIKKTGTDNLGK